MPNFNKTLFVCTGNVFRSIIAEKLFAQNAFKNGLAFQVRSCGTNPYFKTPHPLLKRIVEKEYSITLSGHQARKLALEDISWASAIVCFTPEHQDAIIRMCPTAKEKTFLIYDISSLDPALFSDIDYHDISEDNELLLRGLRALKAAVDVITEPLSLSIIMAVYNEEKNIKNILIKLIAQCSRREVKEIIVVSSGSIDRTDEIVSSIQSPLLTLVREHTRKGKVSALKKAASLVNGDVVLLIDGDIDIDNNFIQECFSCIHSKKIPCTGRVVPIPTKNRFFCGLSKVSCDAWNILRDKCDKMGTFLYPSGYTLLVSRSDFISGIDEISETAINDDGQLSLILFRKGVLFHYSDNLRVYVTFPQSFRDFFKQKIRTRMGRRQIASSFFKEIEKQWRKELIGTINVSNFLFVFAFLAMDSVARCAAGVKIRFSRMPHLWDPVKTTKGVQFSTTAIPTKKTDV